jgi:hypothetical protein
MSLAQTCCCPVLRCAVGPGMIALMHDHWTRKPHGSLRVMYWTAVQM